MAAPRHTHGAHQHDNLRLDSGAVTVRSVINQRRTQQDAVAVTDDTVAVADGLGGHPDGDVASRAAATTITEHRHRDHNNPAALLDAIDVANRAVCALAIDDNWRQPGTTIVAAQRHNDNTITVAWCGDSRAWLRHHNANIEAITVDHTWPGGGLSACLGNHGDDAAAHVEHLAVNRGDGTHIILTSDGIHGALGTGDTTPDEHLAELLGGGDDVATAADTIVETAVANGTDNATIAIIDIERWYQEPR